MSNPRKMICESDKYNGECEIVGYMKRATVIKTKEGKLEVVRGAHFIEIKEDEKEV